MHLREHVWVPAAGLTIWSGAGSSLYEVFPIFPVHFTYPYLTTAFVCVLASVLPDLGNCGYFIVAYFSGKKLAVNSNKWGRRETRIFDLIDRKSYWSWTYKATHSALILILVMSLMFAYVGDLDPILTAYTAGHLLHILMDHVSHRISYIFWPIWTIASEDQNWNWWHWKWLNKKKPDA